jgi:hypothetical protein
MTMNHLMMTAEPTRKWPCRPISNLYHTLDNVHNNATFLKCSEMLHAVRNPYFHSVFQTEVSSGLKELGAVN